MNKNLRSHASCGTPWRTHGDADILTDSVMCVCVCVCTSGLGWRCSKTIGYWSHTHGNLSTAFLVGTMMIMIH